MTAPRGCPSPLLHRFVSSPAPALQSEDDPRATNLDPRSSAQLFLYAVLQIRKAAAMPIIDAMLQGGLQTYAAAADADKDPVFIDAMLHMIVKLHEWLVTDKERKKHVEWLLTTHVAPHLGSPQSYLRARAIQVYVAYSDFKLKDRDHFVAVLGQIYSLLDDSSLLVKVTAGGSLSAFIARSKTGACAAHARRCCCIAAHRRGRATELTAYMACSPCLVRCASPSLPCSPQDSGAARRHAAAEAVHDA